MIRKAVANISSMAALVAFLACLCFGGAFVASAFVDVRCLGATVVSAVWSHLASVKADALKEPPLQVVCLGEGVGGEAKA